MAIIRAGTLGPHQRSLLRAFLTHAVWSQDRLYSYGYDVEASCIHCGSADTLFHRLFKCPCTQDARAAYFSQEELTWLEHSPCRAVLLQGLQLLPHLPDERPPGLGYEPCQSWTLCGGPLSDVMHGTVFTDGSCLKYGAPTWNAAAWSVVRVS